MPFRLHTRTADLLFVGLVATVLYLRFFQFPLVPIDPATGDQAMFLWGALNILDGKVIYRDFSQFTTPGTEYLFALLIRWFGQSAVLPKAVTWAVGVAFSALGVTISRFVLSGWKVYLPSLLFLTAGFLPLQDVTHHAFSTLTALLGMVLLLPDARRPHVGVLRAGVAGFFAGMSFCFTPTRGALIAGAFAVFLWLDDEGGTQRAGSRRRLILALVSAFLLTAVLLLAPVFWKAGEAAVLENLIRFPLHEYRLEPWNNLSAYGSDLPPVTLSLHHPLASILESRALVRWLLIYLIIPWIYLPAGLRILKTFRKNETGSSAQSQRGALLICLTGIALFLSVAYAPTFFRMGVISMPAIVLLAWMLATSRNRFFGIVTLSLAMFAIMTLTAGILHSQGRNTTVDTPSGKIALSASVAESSEEKYLFLRSHTHPGDYFFTPGSLEYAYLFRLRHSSPVSSMSVYAYTTDEDVRRTIEEIGHERPEYIFWPVDAQTVTTNAEAIRGTEDHLLQLREYLQQNYDRVHTFSDFEEVWKRKPDR